MKATEMGMGMLIDCDSCAVRDLACGDCVVTVLLGPRAGIVELDSAEQVALGALAGGGLLPPLRLVPARPPEVPASPGSAVPPGDTPGQTTRATSSTSAIA